MDGCSIDLRDEIDDTMSMKTQIHEIIHMSLWILKYLLVIMIPFVLGIRVTLWKIDNLED